MKLRLFLVGIIVFVAVVLVSITGQIVPLLLVLKSFFFFLLQFIAGLFAIWVLGQGGLYFWMKFETKRKMRRRQIRLRNSFDKI